jgi:mRNA interferase HigB
MGTWDRNKPMHVISYKAIREFKAKHPSSAAGLETWYRVAKNLKPENFAELKQVFGSADYVKGHVVFNIGGNNYRLVANIHFRSKTLFVRRIFTHPEYNKWRA